MIERVLLAGLLVGIGVMAYQGALMMQRRQAASVAQAETSTRSMLLVFTSPTCAPCKLQQLPIIDRLMMEWSDKIGVRVIDVTEQPDVAKQYGVWSLPTTIVLDASHRIVAINQGVAHAKKLGEQFEQATNEQAVNWSIGQSVDDAIG
ncbi:MAG TPA: thioredoxin domain-containing protein [Anaerolineae bacterium]|nr:thioredoxin domain-containing protein [Anaerolineae bacterium]